MQFGTSYYPELADEAEWTTDLRNMREARLSVLRILEFAWSAYEPREGHYEFGWLDRFLDLAQREDFHVILCTPTATPPPWLTTQYPEVMAELRDGTRRAPGGRRDVDVDSEILRAYAVEICTILGRRYGRHPAVIGWQIDNELFGPEGPDTPPECHTRASTFRFRQYLKRVHGGLDTLNHRWGTRFWSQEYSDWGEVGTPRNPRSTMGQVLDYSRYFSHSQAEFIRLQADALRAVIDPAQFVTHNSTAIFDRGLDHTEMQASLNVAGWDAYPGAAGRPHPQAFAALAHDLFRCAKNKPFWVLETAPANGGFTPAFVAEMYAHGAAACLLWHWRCHRSNAEQGNDAVADYTGRPWTDRVKLLRALADRPELQAPLPAELPRRRTALLYCLDAVRTGLTPDPYIRRGVANDIPYLRLLIETYHALWQLGIPVDVVRPGEALEGYDLLVMPSARLLSREAADQVRGFVSRGGTLLATAKTAHQDVWGAFYPTLGEPLADVLGFTVRRDFRCAVPLSVRMADGATHACEPYAEKVDPTKAHVLGVFEGGGVFDGAPAALTHAFGRGEVFYAAGCAPALIRKLARLAAARAGIRTIDLDLSMVAVLPHATTPGVWVFNHGENDVRVGDRIVQAHDFTLFPGLDAVCAGA